jgi:hypothetical protein
MLTLKPGERAWLRLSDAVENEGALAIIRGAGGAWGREGRAVAFTTPTVGAVAVEVRAVSPGRATVKFTPAHGPAGSAVSFEVVVEEETAEVAAGEDGLPANGVEHPESQQPDLPPPVEVEGRPAGLSLAPGDTPPVATVTLPAEPETSEAPEPPAGAEAFPSESPLAGAVTLPAEPETPVAEEAEHETVEPVASD